MLAFSETSVFAIPVMAGFECVSHRRFDGTRVDILEQTGHVPMAAEDYLLLQDCGIRTVREGLRWHLIEPSPGCFNWSSVERILTAAQLTGMEVIWDLLHFGFPDWINPFHPGFPERFAHFAREAALRIGHAGLYVPVNEISFLAWAAGEAGQFYPWSLNRGEELKLALCNAAAAATVAIKDADPLALIILVDPLIKVHPRTAEDAQTAQQLDDAQYAANDMLMGLGDRDRFRFDVPDYIDIIGVNHYPYSQFYSDRSALAMDDPNRVPLSDLLVAVHARYDRPILVSETGAEGHGRAGWFDYVTEECQQAVRKGVPIYGVCLYPILSHIAWTGERYCANGLFDGGCVSRDVEPNLLRVLMRYQQRIGSL